MNIIRLEDHKKFGIDKIKNIVKDISNVTNDFLNDIKKIDELNKIENIKK